MISCNRCGKECNPDTNWGNCTLCGDDICAECSTGFNEHGECEKCTSQQAKPDKEKQSGRQ